MKFDKKVFIFAIWSIIMVVVCGYLGYLRISFIMEKFDLSLFEALLFFSR